MSEGSRGQLRIYLGNAAGVGKTYAMLGEGHRRAERGTDVVVGFVETHGRKHTEELVAGLEVVPRARLPYRGTVFEEMDLAAVLARKPEVAIVDELAHSNIPGSKHTKRWRDVEDLLDAGIDVISTVNIQHLESLNDVVEKITGVPQRETLPDAVVRAADQVELVDMTPEALRRRMAHGNIYPPEKIDAALTNYFRSRHLGGPRAGGGRTHRRPRRRDPDPTRRPDRRPVLRRGAARRPRHPLGRADRRRPSRAGRAAAADRVAGRQLPPGGRRQHPGGAAHLRPGGERHPAG